MRAPDLRELDVVPVRPRPRSTTVAALATSAVLAAPLLVATATATATTAPGPVDAGSALARGWDVGDVPAAVAASGPGPASLLRAGTTRRTGSLTSSEPGDAVPAAPQRVSGVDVTLDYRAKRLQAVTRYAATPTAAQDSAVYVFLGTRDFDVCEAGVGLAATGFAASSAGTFLDGDRETGSLPVTRTRSGATVTMTATHASFASVDWDCAYAVVTDTASEPVTFQVFGFVRLTDHYQPVLSVGRDRAIEGSYAGRWTTVRPEVGNSGAVAATGVRLTAKGKGLRVRPTSIPIGELGRGRTFWDLALKVRPKGRAGTKKARPKDRKKLRTLRLTATAANAPSSTTTVKIAVKPRLTKPQSLVRRYYWGVERGVTDRGWPNVGVMFVDRRWAYLGLPGRGVPKCGKKVKACKRYTYKAGSGKVRVGKLRGTVDSEGLALGPRKKRQTYWPLVLPKKGARFAVQLYRQDFNGCGLWATSCYTWTENLALDRSGRFVRTRSSLSSFGLPGGPTSYFVDAPADQRGRYQMLSRGRLRLVYANGKREVHTLGVGIDVRGKQSPHDVGLLVGSDNFYR